MEMHFPEKADTLVYHLFFNQADSFDYFADMIFKQVLIEEKSHRFNRNSPFVVKIKYIYHNTNIYSIQENADIFKVIVSIYNQFLFNVVFRQVL